MLCYAILDLTRLYYTIPYYTILWPGIGRGDDTVGNPRRAQIYQFELFELILSSKLDKRFPVEQFEATASQSTAPSPS